MDYNYNELFEISIENAVVVRFDKAGLNRLEKYASKMAEAKQQEEHHKKDCHHEKKRIVTGLLGELALESVLGINIVDWSIGKAKDYHNPDIPGYNVGIKSVEYGKFPIIFKKNNYPQIICIIKKDDFCVYVCGLADINTLNSCQDDSLVLSPALLARGTKTGFWGLDRLKPVKSLTDISIYKNE